MLFASLRTKFIINSALGKKLKNTKDVYKKVMKAEMINIFFYSALPARLNLPVKAIVISRFFKTSKSEALAITTAEYAIDLGIMLLIGFLGTLFFFQKVFYGLNIPMIVVTIVVVLVFALMFFLIPIKFFERNYKKYVKIKSEKKSKISRIFYGVSKLALRIREIWPRILLNKNTVPVFAIVLINWGLRIFVTEAIFLSYGVYFSLVIILAARAIGTFVGGISQIPGGIGARELTTIGIFVAMGVEPNLAISVAIINRLLTIIPLIMGYIFFVGFEKEYGIIKNISLGR